MLNRRSFLVGAGGLLTASFVRKATAFSRKVGEPLVLPIAKKPEETLYVWEDHSDYSKWRVSLGPNQLEAPPSPIWREHLRSLGHSLNTRTTSTASAPSRDLSRKISTSASTALAGKTGGTTSLALRQGHIIY
jgi:hypothetical protein